MFYAGINREQLLEAFPKGGNICEVGVFGGEFSKKIIDIVRPQSLDLIDVWKWTYFDWDNPPLAELQNIESFKTWAKSYFSFYDGGHPDRLLERLYQDVSEMARSESRATINVHRGFATEVAKNLPDSSFDAIYIDADHHYDSVLADLFAYAPKLRSGGVLFGDDFLEDLSRKDGLYGTIYAVETFLKRSDFHCLLLTGFGEAQYVLYKETSDYVDELLSNLLNRGVVLVELPDSMIGRFVQKTLATSSTARQVPSFV